MPTTMAEVLHLMVDYLFNILRVETRFTEPSASAPGSLGKVAVTGEGADTESNELVPNTDSTALRAELLILQPAPPPPPGGDRAAGAAAGGGTAE